MSLLKVSTIKSTSGISTSTPEELSKGRAKVWWNYMQRTGPTITNSYNVSSITDYATGQYTVNFAITCINPCGSSSASYNADAFDSQYSDVTNLYATNTTASVETSNMSAASFPTGSGGLHDCDFNYGFILDTN
tara:strand:- start:662 stop:1063 length:402 start_codon:yes stop_codon:yes gene_type:complete